MSRPGAAGAFAQGAADDGIRLEPQSFDWLCEQGHVGLERVAKDRRDPALREPVTVALKALATIRIAAADGDGAAAYRRHRSSLLSLR